MPISSKNACMICLEEHPIPGKAKFNCNCTGTFHNNCLSEWYITYPSTCPLCRKKVSQGVQPPQRVQPIQQIRQPITQPISQPISQPLLQRQIPEYQVIHIPREYSHVGVSPQIVNNFKLIGGFIIGALICLSIYYIVTLY